MNIRISQFLNAENITQSQFADTIGVARASISHIISGRNKPSYDFISSVMKHYPRLNPQWLILGKGRMYIDQEQQQDLLFPVEAVDKTYSDKVFTDGRTVVSPGTVSPQTEAEDASASVSDCDSVHDSKSSAKDIAENVVKTAGTGPESVKRINRIIVLFDDGSFQELK